MSKTDTAGDTSAPAVDANVPSASSSTLQLSKGTDVERVTLDVPLPSKESLEWQKKQRYVFALFMLLQVFLNYDLGAMAIITNWIQDPYKFSDTDLGFLCSLAYGGLILFSPSLGFFFNYFEIQHVIGLGLLANAASLVIFVFAKHKALFFLSRFLVGGSQSFFVIYAPVWVGCFAPVSSQSMWMAILQGSIIAGVMLGYSASALFHMIGDEAWRYNFALQSCILLVLCYVFLSVPKELVDINAKVDFNGCTATATCAGTADGTTSTTTSVSAFSVASSIDSTSATVMNTMPVVSKFRTSPMFHNGAKGRSNSDSTKRRAMSVCSQLPSSIGVAGFGPIKIRSAASRGHGSNAMRVTWGSFDFEGLSRRQSQSSTNLVANLDEQHENADAKQKQHKLSNIGNRNSEDKNANASLVPDHAPTHVSFHQSLSRESLSESKWCEDFNMERPQIMENFWTIVKSPIFCIATFTVSMLYYILTSIHYWMTKIMLSMFDVPESVIYSGFVATSTTAPVLGVIAGSYVIDWINTKFIHGTLFTDVMLFAWGIICFLAGLSACLWQTYYNLIACVWIILFFGGCILPSLTLIAINRIDEPLRPMASSINMCIYHILGYMGGTAIPGIVMDTTGKVSSAIIATFAPNAIGVAAFFCIIMVDYKNRNHLAQMQTKVIQQIEAQAAAQARAESMV